MTMLLHQTNILEVGSSGADSKKSCSNLGCLDRGECPEMLGKPTWMSLVVGLGRYGCNYEGDLRIFLNIG
jgi:hypothetical protein